MRRCRCCVRINYACARWVEVGWVEVGWVRVGWSGVGRIGTRGVGVRLVRRCVRPIVECHRFDGCVGGSRRCPSVEEPADADRSTLCAHGRSRNSVRSTPAVARRRRWFVARVARRYVRHVSARRNTRRSPSRSARDLARSSRGMEVWRTEWGAGRRCRCVGASSICK
ncbi:unannotated protein [freshwater metagenome]|uniref:Unannotated protein n=1 Tax=freshwater metagenome TaxID=449393 RepID=A0A6J6DJP4_9ZZZZ